MYDFLIIKAKAFSRIKGNLLELSSELAESLNLSDDESISLFVGKRSSSFRVKIKAGMSSKVINLNPLHLKSIYLRNTQSYGIFRMEDGLHLGPVIGIMADSSSSPGRPFGGQSYFIKQLIIQGRGLGEICFAFSPFNVNFAKRVIYGYSWAKNGWYQRTFPLPDVVYPREGGYSPSKLRIRKKLENMGCKFINPPLMGKWKTYQLISQNPKLQPYIPETRLANNLKQVDRMIRRHRGVYIKPINGSQGRNIVKVKKPRGSALFQYQYQASQQPQRGVTSNVTNLHRNLRRFMGKRSYIVQQEINLLRSGGNILDVRVLIQKDHSGSWGITGKACRIGRSGSITSNISSGGSGSRVETILKRCFSDPQKRQNILQELDEVAIEVARTLDNNQGLVGELGIDLGIDKTGRIWFIEANLRPARYVFSLIGATHTRRTSIRKPLLYARYLAGFSKLNNPQYDIEVISGKED